MHVKWPFTYTHITHMQDPTLCEEDLVELGMPIRLHRRRLLALIADVARHGVPPGALAVPSSPATVGPQKDKAVLSSFLVEKDMASLAASGIGSATVGAGGRDPIQQELWEAARLELLALEEQETAADASTTGVVVGSAAGCGGSASASDQTRAEEAS